MMSRFVRLVLRSVMLMTMLSPMAMLAPAGTPSAIVTRLNTEFNAALKPAEMRERLLKQDFEIASGTPEQFAVYLRAEIEKWTKVVREARIRLG